MNLSINGQSQVPPGFRFHPTEEELLHYYLRKKVAYEKIDLDFIHEVDLNKLEPWDIQEKCKIGSTPQNDWYFFSHKDRKYPTGTRTNRATVAGFWKATGRDKIIYSGFQRIGLRKTLVFYKGRAPHGQKSDWIMHEYRLDDNTLDTNVSNSSIGDSMVEEGWVVCRVFRKKNICQKALESPPKISSMDSKTQMLCSSNDGVLDQILHYMGKTCKIENDVTFTNNLGVMDPINDEFMHLPRLESPNTLPCNYQSIDEIIAEADQPHQGSGSDVTAATNVGNRLSDWVTLDRLVASQLNGTNQVETSCFGDPNADEDELQLSHLNLHRSNQIGQSYGNENDLWGFTKSSSSSSDPLCHLSV